MVLDKLSTTIYPPIDFSSCEVTLGSLCNASQYEFIKTIILRLTCDSTQIKFMTETELLQSLSLNHCKLCYR